MRSGCRRGGAEYVQGAVPEVRNALQVLRGSAGTLGIAAKVRDASRLPSRGWGCQQLLR